MNELREYILEFIWNGNSVAQFEKWLYIQDSDNFERLLGSENYVDLISYDFKRKTIDQIKQLLKSVIPEEIKKEFELELKKREKAIKGRCVKSKALNPWGNEMRDWELEIGKEYEFIIVSKGMKNKKYPPTVIYINRENYYRPSGFVPAELFEIDLEDISDFYHIIETDESEQLIELKDLSDKFYKPVHYSFWEDFYDDEDKAVNLYYDTIDRLGVKNAW